MSQSSGRCADMCGSSCTFRPHRHGFSVPKVAHDHQELLVSRSENERFHDLGMICAMKSLCKAFEHIKTPFWPMRGWSVMFCYIILSEEGFHRWDCMDQVSLERANRTSAVPRFCIVKTEVW